MARVKYVLKARKDNPVCKAGEPYYWWAFRFGGKRYSLTPPRPSQLTQSAFKSGAAAMSETVEDFSGNVDDLADFRDDLVNQARELSEMAGESFENMPEGLQQGDTGLMLEERRDGMEEIADTLEGIDLEFDEDEARSAAGEADENASPEDVENRLDEAREEWGVEKQTEIEGAVEYGGS